MSRVIQSLVTFTVLLGCAEGTPRPGQEITPRPALDQGIILDLGRRGDANVSTPPVDAGVQSVRADRSVWVVIGDEPFASAPRARLSPPQAPIYSTPSEILETLDGAVALVTWTGPETRGDRLARSLLQSGRPAIPLITLPFDRLTGQSDEQLRLELRYVEVHLLMPQAELMDEPRPAFALRWAEADRADIERFITLSGELNSRPRVVILDAPNTLVTSPESIRVSPCSRADIRPDLDTWDVPCVAAPFLPMDNSRFSWSLIEARREVDVLGEVLLVDGVGRWTDDRQIDPIVDQDSVGAGGDGSTMPVPSYGHGRLLAVQRLIASADMPASLYELLSEPYLVAPTMSLTVSVQDDDLLRIDGEVEGNEQRGAILNRRPWLAPSGKALMYRRSHTGVHLRFIDARGRSSMGPPQNALNICLSLSEESAVRIEELELVRTEGASGRSFSLTDVRLVPRGDPECQELLDSDDLSP